MKNPGVFAVSRALSDHQIFKDEPFCERFAWVWILGAAAFKPMRVRIGRKMVALERGQLAFSERFMAEKFGWPKTRVRRFIRRLESEAMLDRKADHDITILTICNYGKYAFDGERRRTTNEPQSGPQVDHKWTKEEELKEDNRKEGDAGGISKQAFDLSDAFLAAIGADREAPEWMGTPYRVDIWLRQGWTEPIVIAAARKVMAGRNKPPHLNYFEKAIATEFANQNAPVPIAEAGARRNGTPKRGALDVLREIISAEDGVSVEADRNVVVSLPQRRLGGP